MTPVRKYATYAVALAVMVAGYININRVYATQCDDCDSPKVQSATTQNSNSASNTSTNSSSGNGATLGVGASDRNTPQDNSSDSSVQTGIGTDTTSSSDTSANTTKTSQYQLQYEAISTPCSQLAGQYSASIASLVNFTNSLSVKEQAIASQILGIASLQATDMDGALEALDKAQTQSGIKTFFLGPDYSQLKITKQVWQRNQLRIQELNQIKSQLSNTSDAQNLEAQITTLEQQNESIMQALENQTKIFSIFGWANRLISQY